MGRASRSGGGRRWTCARLGRCRMDNPSQLPRGGVASQEDGRPSVLATCVLALLVVVSITSFFVIQRLKHTPTAVQGFERTPSFSPTAIPAASCRAPLSRAEVLASKRLEYFSFRTAHTERVSVSVISRSGRLIARIVNHLPLHAYRRVSLCWNGQRGASESGGLVSAGEYRLQIGLSPSGREVDSPLVFMLRTR